GLLDRDYLRYAVYWPAPGGLRPTTLNWTQEQVPRTWRSARFNSSDGRVQLGGSAYLYYVPSMHGQTLPTAQSADDAFPASCPRCDAFWWSPRRRIGSSIRTMRTGFQKIAQVLSDALLRDI